MFAAFAMSASSLSVVINALRLRTVRVQGAIGVVAPGTCTAMGVTWLGKDVGN